MLGKGNSTTMTTFNHDSHPPQDFILPSPRHQQDNAEHDGDNAGNTSSDIGVGVEDKPSEVEDVKKVNKKVDIAPSSAEEIGSESGSRSGLEEMNIDSGLSLGSGLDQVTNGDEDEDEGEDDIGDNKLEPAPAKSQLQTTLAVMSVKSEPQAEEASLSSTERKPIPQTVDFMPIDIWYMIARTLKDDGNSRSLNNLRHTSWYYNRQFTELKWRFIRIKESTLESFFERLVRGKRLRQAGFDESEDSFRPAEANLIQGFSLIKDITFDSITTGPSYKLVKQLEELHRFQQLLNSIYSPEWRRESAKGITTLLMGRLENIPFINCDYKSVLAISRILRNLCSPVTTCIKSRDGDISRIHLANIAGALFRDPVGTQEEAKTINVHQAHPNFDLGKHYPPTIKSRISLDLIKGCGCPYHKHQDPDAEERCLRKGLTDSLGGVYISVYIGGEVKFQNASTDGLLEILEPIPRSTSDGYSLLLEVADEVLSIITNCFFQEGEVDDRWSSREAFVEQCQKLVIFKIGDEIDWSREPNCQCCRSSLNIAVRPATAAESGVSPDIQQAAETESQDTAIDDSLLC